MMKVVAKELVLKIVKALARFFAACFGFVSLMISWQLFLLLQMSFGTEGRLFDARKLPVYHQERIVLFALILLICALFSYRLTRFGFHKQKGT